MSTLMLFSEKSSRSLSEFQFPQDHKDRASKLGKGTFASVQLIQEKKTGNLFALKKITINPLKISRSDIHNLRSEIQIHKQLDHPNIIKFHDYIQEGANMCLILDYAPNGTLYTYLHKKKLLTPNEVFHCFYHTCLAIQYLHQKDIVHRDLKPENLLLDKDLNIKLCDFGWAARSIKEKRTTFCGTYEYMAPEIVRKKPYDYRVDIWALGVLLYELTHREAPYKGRTLPEIINSFSNTTLSFDSSIEPDVKDLIQKILRIDPNERLPLSDILSHSWIRYHLSKYEDTENSMANPPSSITNTERAPPPRLAQNTGNLNRDLSKENKEFRTFTPEKTGEVHMRNINFHYPASAVNYTSRQREDSGQPSPNISQFTLTMERTFSENLYKQTQNPKPNQNTTMNTTMTEGFYMNKNHSHSATNCKGYQSNEPKKAPIDPKSRKVFQKDIMSPDFQAKLSSLLGHINVPSPLGTRNMNSNAVASKSYNKEASPCPTSRFDKNTPIINPWSTQADITCNDDPSPRVWPHNLNPKLPIPSLDSMHKPKFFAAPQRSALKLQNSNLTLNMENTQPVEEKSQSILSPTFKLNFISRTNPGGSKTYLQQESVFDPNNTSVKSRIDLNDTLPKAVHLKRAKTDEASNYESNVVHGSGGQEQKKTPSKWIDTSFRGVQVPLVVKYGRNKENKGETSRVEKPSGHLSVQHDKLYTHR